MIHHIRPHVLFALVPEQSADDRMVQMKIPIRRRPEVPDYSLRLLELMVLIACSRIVEAERVFEIGTFCGNTALHLAVNEPFPTVFTLDADEATLRASGLYDLYRWRDEFPLESANRANVATLRGDSRTFDFAPWRRSIDLVVVDGDHSRNAVMNDTLAATSMLRPGGMIAWHDYGNPGTSDNTAFLDDSPLTLFHIEDTMLALYFANPEIQQKLEAAVVQSEGACV